MIASAQPLPGSLYDYPRYYDLIFNDERAREVGFLTDCFALYAGRPVLRVYEPACGSGRLLVDLARRGLTVVGCDINAGAVSHLNRRLRRLGLPPTAAVADMCVVRVRPKVHAAFNLISSFQHLLTEAEAEAHLRAVASSLVRGGVYVLGSDLCPSGRRRRTSGVWTRSRGSLSITTTLRTRRVAWRRRLEVCRMRSLIRDGKTLKVIEEDLRFRTYTLRQVKRLFARVPEFEVVASYDLSYEVYSSERVDGDSRGAVFVLRRR